MLRKTRLSRQVTVMTRQEIESRWLWRAVQKPLYLYPRRHPPIFGLAPMPAEGSTSAGAACSELPITNLNLLTKALGQDGKRRQVTTLLAARDIDRFGSRRAMVIPVVQKHIFRVLIMKNKYLAALLLTIGLSTANAQTLHLGALAPPDVSAVDEFGVDLINGLVRPHLKTLSIGGELGLTHHITAEGHHFQRQSSRGYTDAFDGNARYVEVGTNIYIDKPERYSGIEPVYLMRVFGPEGTRDFGVYRNGNLVRNANSLTTNFTYRVIGDTGDTLQIDGEYLKWTSSKGVVTRYRRYPGGSNPATAATKGELEDITYPNGFKIDVTLSAVTTNTGIQLRYYRTDWGTLTPEKQAIYDQLVADGRAPANTGGWNINPAYIRGINLAHEHCVEDCTNDWPAVTFFWEQGAPLAYDIGDSLFRVTDAWGGITEYHYRAFNVCETSGGISTECANRTPNPWSPRLVAIKSADSKVVDREYAYVNDGYFEMYPSPGAQFSFWTISSKSGVIAGARYRDRTTTYSFPWQSDMGDSYYRSNYNGSQAVIRKYTRSHLYRLSSNYNNDRYFYEINARNYLKSHASTVGKYYHYDQRGNLTKVVTSGQRPTANTSMVNDCHPDEQCSIVLAHYSEQCSNPKTCNKPIWIESNGNRTEYTYHPDSGQVETVTGPPVQVGGQTVRPKTTYQYENLFAYYKKNSQTIQKADSGIWLLTSEFKCLTSNATVDSCEAGDIDKIETRYYYGPQDGSPNNLFLRGKSITAGNQFNTISTRVVCYNYDKVGNLIGEIAPKASYSLTSCP